VGSDSFHQFGAIVGIELEVSRIGVLLRRTGFDMQAPGNFGKRVALGQPKADLAFLSRKRNIPKTPEKAELSRLLVPDGDQSEPVFPGGGVKAVGAEHEPPPGVLPAHHRRRCLFALCDGG